MAQFLTEQTLGDVFGGQAYNDNLDHIESVFKDLGPWIISGLVPAAGTGLSVDVSLGVALFGGRLNVAAPFTIGGLTNGTTNHLYLLNTGVGTSNTTGTAPADSVKLGTAVTAAGVVSSVQTNWASGRQLLVRHENLVHGSGAGHPRAVDLASHHATNNEGNEVKGTLPSSAMAGLARSTKTANYTLVSTDDIINGDATGGSFTLTLPPVAGRSRPYWINKIDSSVNTVTLDGDGSELIVGATTLVLTVQWEAVILVPCGTFWSVF